MILVTLNPSLKVILILLKIYFSLCNGLSKLKPYLFEPLLSSDDENKELVGALEIGEINDEKLLDSPLHELELFIGVYM